MKNKCLFLFMLGGILLGCESEEPAPVVENKSPEPTEPAPEEEETSPAATLSIMSGDEQNGVFGGLLKDSLAFKVTLNDNSTPVDQYFIKAELVEGNGDIHYNSYDPYAQVKASGTVKIGWSLGCDAHNQKVKIYLYPKCIDDRSSVLSGNCKPIDSLFVTAMAEKPVGWAKSCGIRSASLYYTRFREYNGVLYLVNDGVLYLSNDAGVNWNKMEGLPDKGTEPWGIRVREIEFNSKGWMYMVTEEDGVFYSEDLKSWKSISNGILDPRTPTTFLVEDSYLFVGFYFDGFYRSSDNGASWNKILINGRYDEEYAFLNRHPNGDLFLFDKWETLWRSSTNGDQWEIIDGVLFHYVISSAHDLAIDQEGKLYLGSEDATIAILSSKDFKGEKYSYYEANSAIQHVDNIRFLNGEVYFLVNQSPNNGIYSSKNGYGKLNLDFEEDIHEFHLRPDGSFLFANWNGIHYYSK